jgi:hypothetical protein
MCLRGLLADGLSKVSDDRHIGVEEMVPCHAWLLWDASRNDNDLDSLECIAQLLWCIPIDFSSSLNMAHIGSNARSPMNITQAKGVSGTHSASHHLAYSCSVDCCLQCSFTGSGSGDVLG